MISIFHASHPAIRVADIKADPLKLTIRHTCSPASYEGRSRSGGDAAEQHDDDDDDDDYGTDR